MSIRNIWNVPCLETLTSKRSNSPSYINVLSTGFFSRDTKGQIMPSFNVLSRWEYLSGIKDGAVSIQLTYPDGETSDSPPLISGINEDGAGILELEMEVNNLVSKQVGPVYLTTILIDKSGRYEGIQTPLYMKERVSPD